LTSKRKILIISAEIPSFQMSWNSSASCRFDTAWKRKSLLRRTRFSKALHYHQWLSVVIPVTASLMLTAWIIGNYAISKQILAIILIGYVVLETMIVVYEIKMTDFLIEFLVHTMLTRKASTGKSQ
jgi:hypothetical protein